MKLHEEDRGVVTSGGFEEQDFGIDEASLHVVFDVLRSKVYSNPIGSLCREIASNARDAQREAGVSSPVEIEIREGKPRDIWDGDSGGVSIVFRDRGVGISPDRMRDVYAKYGASTKRDTNALTGGFGLGAKTPFAYADAFTVITVVDGTRYFYSIYIDQSKRGRIALTDSEPTGERNGTEVVVPLQRKDVAAFEHEVVKSTHFWDVQPKLIGFTYASHRPLNPAKLGTTISVPGVYSLVEPRTRFIESTINVVIDGIYYPVDSRLIEDEMVGASIVMPFGNGELTVGANREQLQYDDRTKELISARLEASRAIISKGYDDAFASKKNLLGAVELDASLRIRDELYGSIVKTTPRRWVGPDGTEHTLNRKPWEMKAHEVTVYTATSGRRHKQVLDRLDTYQVEKMQVYYRALGDKVRPGALTKLLEQHTSFVLVSQRPPVLDPETGRPKDYEGYRDALEHDANAVLTLGIALQDMNGVQVNKPKRAPVEKRTIVLRTVSAGRIFRCTYDTDGNDLFRPQSKSPLQLVVYWLDNESRAVPESEADLLRSIGSVVRLVNNVRDPASSREVVLVAASKSKAQRIGGFVEVDDFLRSSPVVADYMNYQENFRLMKEVAPLDLRYPTAEQRAAHAEIAALYKRVTKMGTQTLIVPDLVRYVRSKKLVQTVEMVDPVGDRSDMPLLPHIPDGHKSTYANMVLELRALRAEIAVLRTTKQNAEYEHA